MKRPLSPTEGYDVESLRVPVARVLESGCRFIHDYWQSLRRGRMAPAWDEFDLIRLPPRAIAFTRIIDVRRDPFDLVYRFWGTGLVNLLGEERTGKSLLGINAARVLQTIKEYEAVVEERAPYALVYNLVPARPRKPHYAPAIRLPLSDDGETVTHIAAYAQLDADAESWRKAFERGHPSGG